MNVTELYRELKMTKDEFFVLVNELGFDIGERAIKIDDAVAVKIIQAIRQHRKSQNKTSIFADDEGTTAESEERTNEDGLPILSIPDQITVKEFADRTGKGVPEMIAILLQNGIMATINESLDYETAAIIAEDMGYFPEQSSEESDSADEDTRAAKVEQAVANEESLESRPPVIVIMGHVDHGKTTLLDTIRNANVTAKESGGITQHIGAYQVEQNGRKLTFIDTPGHEAFTTMRSRGARVADIAILVVAADDGIKPQTIESVQILQEAELPFIVAINKVDKPQADIDRTKKELSELNLIPEDYGGDTICVPVSALKSEGIDKLLETLLLVADVEQEQIRANPEGAVVGSIIESHVDKHTGPVATILVQNGTLRIGDIVQIGNIPGRVRALKDWHGTAVKEAPPSTPVMVIGLKKAPVVGDILEVVKDKKVLKKRVKSYDSFSFLQTRTGQQSSDDESEKKSLAMILRCDKLGSLEALVQSLEEIEHEEVALNIIQKGLGNITENDIALARSANAFVAGFHVGITPGAQKFASDEKINVQQFEVIYKLIDQTKEELQQLLSKKISYNKIGSLKLLAVFKKQQSYVIAGGRVQDGVMRNSVPVKIMRGGEMIGEGVISQLQKDKQNIGEVTKGSECGMRIETDIALQEDDLIEAYEAVEQERSL